MPDSQSVFTFQTLGKQAPKTRNSFQFQKQVTGWPACTSGTSICWKTAPAISLLLGSYPPILEPKKPVSCQQECWCERHNFQKWSPSPGLRTGTNDSISCELPLAWLTRQSPAGPFQRCRQQWPLSNWRTSTVGSSHRAPAGAASNSEGSCWQCVVVTAGGHVLLPYGLKNPQVFESWMGTYVWDLKSHPSIS